MHNRFRLLASVLLGLGLLVPSALASEKYRHKEAGIQLEVPDGWSAELDRENQILHLESSDEKAYLALWVPKNKDFEDLDDTLECLESELGYVFDDDSVKLEKEAKDFTLNGINGVEIRGVAKYQGKTIKWIVKVLAATKLVVVVGFAETANWATANDTLNRVFESIERIE